MPAIVQILLYVTAFALFVGVFEFLISDAVAGRTGRRRVNRRLDLLQGGLPPEKIYASLVRNPGGLTFGHEGLEAHYQRLGNALRQAGLRISPQRLIGAVALAALALWAVGLFAMRARPGDFVANATLSLIGAVLLAGGGAWNFVTGRRRARRKRLEEQLPLALDVVNRALRAGHPVVSAVQLASAEMADPIGSELGLVVDEATYGAEFKDALGNFARRSGSTDVHFFAVSVSIQTETGGNLAEILEGLASVIRGRITLGKRVKALASEGKATALLLSVLPVLLVGALLLMRPDFYSSKFGDPIFWPTVGGVAAMYLIGLYAFHRITNFKY